jgi:hypothetical protein
MSQILVLIYQGLYKNHSFISRRSWDWIHINETSIEFGSQSRSPRKVTVCIIIFALFWFLTFWFGFFFICLCVFLFCFCFDIYSRPWLGTKFDWCLIDSKNNYAHCDFPGYSKCEKNIYCDFFSGDFFSTDATHTYDIILNTDTISILIPSIPTPSTYKGMILIETLIYENQNLTH